ncbi:hypothetical protein RJT34_07785 [Clitoria ternatea]|uniref:Transcription factor CBF/NF-Y/archaeal histone domain-containing protein n=1 Tax=Clitoria ternatea TaxID=43366 RepID=A0AAN9K3S2_CLITE
MAGVREQNQYMPIANVIRVMRRILPSHAKISDDAKETIQECVSEYISFITAEANERCQREQRKTVTAEDVLWAMGKLGFDDYVHPLAVYLQRYRHCEGEPRRINSSASSSAMQMQMQMQTQMQTQYPAPHGLGMYEFDTAQGFYRDDASASASASVIANLDPFVHSHIKRDPCE